jgi:hypothetical protein
MRPLADSTTRNSVPSTSVVRRFGARRVTRRAVRTFLVSPAIVASAMVLASSTAQAQQETRAPSAVTATTGRAPAVNQIVVLYISTWNERNAERRRELVAKTWVEDGSYIDARRNGVGHDAIDAMIAKAQDQFPGYRLRLVSTIESHNGNVRFSWAAGGTDEAPVYIGGTDIVALAADGRMKTVVGFADAPGSPVPPVSAQSASRK